MNRWRLVILLVISSCLSIVFNVHQQTTSLLLENNTHYGFEIPFSSPLSLCPFKTIAHPVFRETEIPDKPLSVGLVTLDYPFTVTTKHILVDGIEHSRFLNLTHLCLMRVNHGCQVDPSVDLYIMDLVRLRRLDDEFLNHNFTQQLLHPAGNPTWKVLLVDYTDQIHFNQQNFFERLGLDMNVTHSSDELPTFNHSQTHLRLALSSVVQGRRYNRDTHQINPGFMYPINQWHVGGGPILHSSYAVRSDIVHGMQQHLDDQYCRGIYRRPRPMDVIHLWEPKTGSKQTQFAARYRDDVSYLVQSLNGTATKEGRTLQSTTKIHGQLGVKARSNVNHEYVQALLSTKIVVVTQRDKWEDHYRLFEAMSGGAMAISDAMLSLPKGLVNGTHLVLFQSVEELNSLIEHYLSNKDQRLQIANEGWRLALQKHRSWHRMEELVFGCPLTNVNEKWCGAWSMTNINDQR